MTNSKISDTIRGALSRLDSWSNAFTGLGTARDKVTHSIFQGTVLNDNLLDDLYHNNAMAARACDVVPEEMLRRGFKINTDEVSPDVVEAIQIALAELGVGQKYIDASTWARVFGGSVIYVGADDGARDDLLSEPLNEEGIKVLDHLNVVDRRFAEPLAWYTNPSEKKFGEPKTYMISSMGAGGNTVITPFEVHESRVIRFDGLRCSATFRQKNNGWGLSTIQRMDEVLRDFGTSFQALAHLMTDANQGVFKMKGLFEAIASNNEDFIRNRMELIEMGKSVVRGIVLDADLEEYERQSFAWAGIGEPLKMLMLLLSATARIPVTILMGQSPAGMDATGESDIRWFYDQTESAQNNYVDPKIKALIRLLTLSKSGPTNGKELIKYTIDYPPLWQPTEIEESSMRKTQAEMDALYIDAGVVLPEEIAISRFSSDGWTPETNIDVELRTDMLSVLKKLPGDPEPDPEPDPMEERQ